MNTRTCSLFKAIALGFLLFLLSCGKDDPEPEQTNFIEAKVNGQLWQPGSLNCILLIDTTYNFRIVNFTASSAGKTITIEASDNATGGAVNIGTRTFDAGSAFFSYNSSGIPYNAISGSINITAVEASARLVTGTFEFTVEDNSGNLVEVTGGKFVKVLYIVKNQ